MSASEGELFTFYPVGIQVAGYAFNVDGIKYDSYYMTLSPGYHKVRLQTFYTLYATGTNMSTNNYRCKYVHPYLWVAANRYYAVNLTALPKPASNMTVALVPDRNPFTMICASAGYACI